ncbi:MAG: Asp23/Gls24 family envelope stress response protein [Oscillospiraceae bacterium]|jgi:uncharacterized alkaline shock family protein YloU|nr:Asp23/Gls24 family envelope stress response protein [Oscillospiraceae bacterium]
MKIKTSRGFVYILPEVFTAICGFAATNCFGVKGMASRSASDGLARLLRRDSISKGVKVRFPEPGGSIGIELHIVVEHGINMPALCSSITSEVRYVVEKLTSAAVGTIDIYIDAVMVGA